MRTTSVLSAYHNPSCYELVHKSSLLVFFLGVTPRKRALMREKCFAYQPEIVQLALWQVHDQVVARITYLLELAVLTRCYFELTSFYIFGIKIHVILFDSCVFFPVFSVLFIMVARTISQLVWLCRGNVMFFLKAEIKIVKASLLLWNKIAHKGIPP